MYGHMRYRMKPAFVPNWARDASSDTCFARDSHNKQTKTQLAKARPVHVRDSQERVFGAHASKTVGVPKCLYLASIFGRHLCRVEDCRHGKNWILAVANQACSNPSKRRHFGCVHGKPVCGGITRWQLVVGALKRANTTIEVIKEGTVDCRVFMA